MRYYCILHIIRKHGKTAKPDGELHPAHHMKKAKILAQQIEQERGFAGAGFAYDVDMSAALVRSEHEKSTRCVGAEGESLGLRIQNWKRAGVACASP
jgi:hypothetical protein